MVPIKDLKFGEQIISPKQEKDKVKNLEISFKKQNESPFDGTQINWSRLYCNVVSKKLWPIWVSVPQVYLVLSSLTPQIIRKREGFSFFEL